MLFRNDLQIIEDAETLRQCCATLSTQAVIAVDLEGASLHHYKEQICLMQLSDSTQDYIIDFLAIDDLTPIFEILQNPNILKVMHGADYDVVSLKRDYNITIQNLFDTGIAAQFLNYKGLGLSFIIHKHFGFELDKRFQKYDWMRRPLYPEHIEYARGDTHFLLAIYEILKRELHANGFWDACVEESQVMTCREWTGKQHDAEDFMRMKHVHKLPPLQRKVLRALFEAREEMAQQKDQPVFQVAHNQVLLTIATNYDQPLDVSIAKLSSDQAGAVRKYKSLWQESIAKGLEDTRELPSLIPTEKHSKNQTFHDATTELRAWRTAEMAKGIPAVHLLSNQQIKSIAIVLPTTKTALRGVEDLRTWQIALHGDKIIKMMKKLQKNKSKSS